MKSYSEYVEMLHNQLLGETPYTLEIPNKGWTDKNIQQVWELIQDLDYEEIGELRGETILRVNGGDVRYYALVKKRKPSLVLVLDKDLPFHSLGGFKVRTASKSSSDVFYSEFLKYLAQKENLWIFSDTRQTTQAKKAWKRLLKDTSVNTEIIDAKTGKEFAGAVWDSNSIILLRK